MSLTDALMGGLGSGISGILGSLFGPSQSWGEKFHEGVAKKTKGIAEGYMNTFVDPAAMSQIAGNSILQRLGGGEAIGALMARTGTSFDRTRGSGMYENLMQTSQPDATRGYEQRKNASGGLASLFSNLIAGGLKL